MGQQVLPRLEAMAGMARRGQHLTDQVCLAFVRV